MTEEKPISIRSIQHYMYCPRRFALLELNQDWAENAAVVNANLLHETVHSGKPRHLPKGVLARNSVTVWHDDYALFGVCDCIEFVPDAKGVPIAGLEGSYRVRIVEYKPTAPKDAPFHPSDAIQVYAQKLCADHIWGCDAEAFLYYDSTHRRVRLPFAEEGDAYHAMLMQYLTEMKTMLAQRKIPAAAAKQSCRSCSLYEDCMPGAGGKTVRKMIDECLTEQSG